MAMDAETGQVLDVLDLPQLYTRPPAAQLLSVLESLGSPTPSWGSGTSTPKHKTITIKSEGLPRYLTSIISSPLAWINDETLREQIWETASVRLSERSGRTAMGAISRTFVISESLFITLHEPALTADNLGLKTWASSYVLAKRLLHLKSTLPSLPTGSQILELGSGTGLVGLAAASIFKTNVTLTDLPAIVPNLWRNVQANALTGGAATVAVLDWSNPSDLSLCDRGKVSPNSFPMILAADAIYSGKHPALLAKTVAWHLKKDATARCVVELPLRERYELEREDFRIQMAGNSLVLLDEGTEMGSDDWGEQGESDITCWWSIWLWKAEVLKSYRTRDG
ncbi:glucose-inducible SAM-dependent methyltransferase Rrg1 [Piedraia hortae CBS 480.64]|uniref:Glucose-inducible SAM-dependent methyltransferase Rrg1 n=1 Tax=Piedraia hortae CBS 480.64 TaxID=1314780 RepID=A0A6A7BVV6_9PEZI|nr:glucose-inducible SAM-dependent methyltransferase Rrg1 [Piedraia hortae CBS 480.64]